LSWEWDAWSEEERLLDSYGQGLGQESSGPACIQMPIGDQLPELSFSQSCWRMAIIWAWA